jgi:hypothetical protein
VFLSHVPRLTSAMMSNGVWLACFFSGVACVRSRRIALIRTARYLSAFGFSGMICLQHCTIVRLNAAGTWIQRYLILHHKKGKIFQEIENNIIFP